MSEKVCPECGSDSWSSYAVNKDRACLNDFHNTVDPFVYMAREAGYADPEGTVRRMWEAAGAVLASADRTPGGQL